MDARTREGVARELMAPGRTFRPPTGSESKGTGSTEEARRPGSMSLEGNRCIGSSNRLVSGSYPSKVEEYRARQGMSKGRR